MVEERVTLKPAPSLQRGALVHAFFVMSFTPVAVLAASTWIVMFGLSVDAMAIWAVAHVLGFIGVTVGLHRYFTHRSFEAPVWLTHVMAIWGMTAAQGSLLFWVSDHRRHHRFADLEHDPHSPQVGGGGLWRRFWHAHMGWMFNHSFANPTLFAPDLLADRQVMQLNRQYPLWIGLGLLAPAVIGAVWGAFEGATLFGFFEGLVWGGIVRVATVHQGTFAVNSATHLFGSRRFATADRSTNLWSLSLFTAGETWHNNHHAFPSSARFGMRWWELDVGFFFIRTLSWLGLAKNVNVARPK
jgi:stearoyl-CoA desaturase (delta-9 desaturase)